MESINTPTTLFDQMANSQFFKELGAIPLVKFGVSKASTVYSKVKVSKKHNFSLSLTQPVLRFSPKASKVDWDSLGLKVLS
jgi:hypothetical protein